MDMKKITPEQTEQVQKQLQELLSKAELELVALKYRFSMVRAVVEELHKQTKGKRFVVRNEVVWQMFWDTYQMVIIDLASLLKAFRKESGFFNQLNNHLRQLRPGVHNRIDRGRIKTLGAASEDEKRRILREHSERRRNLIRDEAAKARKRLFPSLRPEGQVNQQHINELKERLKEEAESLVGDRNIIAHRYEANLADKGLKADIRRMAAHFERVERILGDLRYVAFAGMFDFESPKVSGMDTIARDLVDQALLGSINEVVNKVGAIPDTAEKRYWWQHRDAKGDSLLPPRYAEQGD